jgi:hypothetical protein
LIQIDITIAEINRPPQVCDFSEPASCVVKQGDNRRVTKVLKRRPTSFLQHLADVRFRNNSDRCFGDPWRPHLGHRRLRNHALFLSPSEELLKTAVSDSNGARSPAELKQVNLKSLDVLTNDLRDVSRHARSVEVRLELENGLLVRLDSAGGLVLGSEMTPPGGKEGRHLI